MKKSASSLADRLNWTGIIAFMVQQGGSLLKDGDAGAGYLMICTWNSTRKTRHWT